MGRLERSQAFQQRQEDGHRGQCAGLAGARQSAIWPSTRGDVSSAQLGWGRREPLRARVRYNDYAARRHLTGPAPDGVLSARSRSCGTLKAVTLLLRPAMRCVSLRPPGRRRRMALHEPRRQLLPA